MSQDAKQPSRRWKPLAGGFALVVGLLFVPEAQRPVPELPEARPFLWDRDEVFRALEARFDEARREGCPSDVDAAFAEQAGRRDELVERKAAPNDPAWDQLETGFFELTASLGGCPEKLGELIELRHAQTRAVRALSRTWPRERATRDRLYRVVYGTRMAMEELILQTPKGLAPQVSGQQEVASEGPSIVYEGIEIHSGDLLVSRGGAPTSAFISRGSDYPGNFSHVAIVHIEPDTKEVSIVEAHIERGVAVSTVDAYFADKKLRVLVLRLREDNPELRANPMLPHLAATAALDEVRSRHIPYDFAMDVTETEKQFCSEVASSVYAAQGVELWTFPSTFSSPGLARWMSALGVENLETHGPSDLEYDPQLNVVAEYHDAETLLADHVDNAVIDAMLEQAEAGAEFEHSRVKLPLARLAKAHSMALNALGKVGPVPEGMSATVALRAQWLGERHDALVDAVMERSRRFREDEGYAPPYWKLVEFAREASSAPEP